MTREACGGRGWAQAPRHLRRPKAPALAYRQSRRPCAAGRVLSVSVSVCLSGTGRRAVPLVQHVRRPCPVIIQTRLGYA